MVCDLENKLKVIDTTWAIIGVYCHTVQKKGEIKPRFWCLDPTDRVLTGPHCNAIWWKNPKGSGPSEKTDLFSQKKSFCNNKNLNEAKCIQNQTFWVPTLRNRPVKDPSKFVLHVFERPFFLPTFLVRIYKVLKSGDAELPALLFSGYYCFWLWGDIFIVKGPNHFKGTRNK